MCVNCFVNLASVNSPRAVTEESTTSSFRYLNHLSCALFFLENVRIFQLYRFVTDVFVASPKSISEKSASSPKTLLNIALRL
jgi:hypothetical protein